MTALDRRALALLKRTPISEISSALRGYGLADVHVDGVVMNSGVGRMVGVARTLRLLPYRKDLSESRGGSDSLQRQVIEALDEGDVLVIEARGVRDAGVIGRELVSRAKDARAAGVVTDGAVRDHWSLTDIGIPVFSLGGHPAGLARRHVAWETGGAIACGGVAVLPGDLIVGDEDGVVVIPAAVAADIANEVQERAAAWVVERLPDTISGRGVPDRQGQNTEGRIAGR